MREPVDTAAATDEAVSLETPTDPAARPLTKAEAAEMEACARLGTEYVWPEPPAAPDKE